MPAPGTPRTAGAHVLAAARTGGRPPEAETAQAWVVAHAQSLFDRRSRGGRRAASFVARVGRERLSLADLEVFGVAFLLYVQEALTHGQFGELKEATNAWRSALEFLRKLKALEGPGDRMPGNLTVVVGGDVQVGDRTCQLGADEGDELVVAG